MRTPEQQRAHWSVANAIKSGRLTRPEICEGCGGKPGPRNGKSLIEAHHANGYGPEHLLDVDWLCVRCHKEEHPNPAEVKEAFARINTGKKHTEATRQKMREAWTPELRAKKSRDSRKAWTPERRAAQSASSSGPRELSPESRARLSTNAKRIKPWLYSSANKPKGGDA